MPKRSILQPPIRVPLSESERAQATILSRWGIHLAIRQEAAELLDLGADPDGLRDLRVAVTSSLCGDQAAMKRWGASSPHSIDLARKRVRHLVDGALWLVIVYETGAWRGPGEHVSFLGVFCENPPPGSGLAYLPGSLGDPRIRVQRYPDPVQEELWDLDQVPWTFWASTPAEDGALSKSR